MKLRRRVTTLVALFCFLIVNAVVVFATPNEDVIQALKDTNVPSSYIIQAENYLKNNDVTENQASEIISQINKADDIMEAANTKDASKLSDADIKSVLQAVEDAGSAIELDINVEKKSNGSVSVVAKDSTGSVIADFTSVEVKQTGINNTMLALGGVLVLLSVGSFIVLRKRITT